MRSFRASAIRTQASRIFGRWTSGRPATPTVTNEGWIGKSLRHIPAAASFHLAGNEPAPLALTGAPARVPSIATLGDFQLQEAASGDERPPARAARDAVSTSGVRSKLHSTSCAAPPSRPMRAASACRRSAKNYTPRSTYPETRARQPPEVGGPAHRRRSRSSALLRLAGRLRHARRPGGTHPNLLRDVSDSITAFYRDLAARGHGERPDHDLLGVRPSGHRERQQGHRPRLRGPDAARRRPGAVGHRRRSSEPDAAGGRQSAASHRFPPGLRRLLERWLGVPSRQVLGEAFKAVECLKS